MTVKRALTGLAACSAAVVLSITVAPTAQAAGEARSRPAPVANPAAAPDPAPGSALQGRFWIYGGHNFTGNEYSFGDTDQWFRNNNWHGSTASVDNGASSAANLTNRDGFLWTIGSEAGTACTGDYVHLEPNTSRSNLAPWNNTASCLVLTGP
ncbi:hypothetical protein ACFVIM_29350 [Streptomyces sp. NPDC057638]|uniref:hypothetical protein n=1 Tax=Streptomyces sp. NPDC057638 TaxID=3346190 RepID=UPI00368F660B